MALASGAVVPISQVKVGDQVQATDPATGQTSAQKVTAVWVNHDTDLMDVTVSANGVTSTIHTTQHHPFWDATRHAWVDADQLHPGDHLTTTDGTTAVVTGTAIVPGAGDMWDLTIANTHDFYVTATAPNTTAATATARPDDTTTATLDRTTSSIHTYYVLAGTTPILVHNCNTTTVGRWMSPDEHQAMIDTGKVQAGSGGTSTYVANPADPAAYFRQAAPGSRYVQFDVPTSSLKPGGEPGWAQIPGPNHPIYGPLNARRGLPPPEMPSFENLIWDGTVK